MNPGIAAASRVTSPRAGFTDTTLPLTGYCLPAVEIWTLVVMWLHPQVHETKSHTATAPRHPLRRFTNQFTLQTREPF
jgi:hypothetical protein